MLFLPNVKLRDYTSEPVVWMVFIILLGFVVGAGHVDVMALKKESSLGNSAKLIRAATVGLVFVIACLTLMKSNKLGAVVRGSGGLLFIYFVLAAGSSFISPVRALTLYKSFEILTILLVMATVYASRDRFELSKKLIYALLFFYTITVVGVYVQFAIFGSEGQRQLVGVTPLFGFMLISKYPGMVGNALGYLGALVALFGMFLLSTRDSQNRARFITGLTVFGLGAGVTFFSYTRSIMVFLFVAVFIYAAYRKKYALNILMILMLLLPLGMQDVRNKVMDHMRRGSSDEAISTLSGRTEMWQAVFDRDIMEVIAGGGYATGSKFMNFDKTGRTLEQANVHNGFLEVVMSIGLIGGAVWLTILGRISKQFYNYYKRTRYRLSRDELYFHIFMMSMLFLSIARSIMNSTFVYLDYFFPLLMCFMVYGDALAQKAAAMNSSKDSIDNENTQEAGVKKRDAFTKRSPDILVKAK